MGWGRLMHSQNSLRAVPREAPWPSCSRSVGGSNEGDLFCRREDAACLEQAGRGLNVS